MTDQGQLDFQNIHQATRTSAYGGTQYAPALLYRLCFLLTIAQYGGFWVPASASLFDRKIKSSPTDSPLREWTVDNVGITNGFIDFAHSISFYPEYAFNNTYEPLITEEVYSAAKESYTSEGGCADLIKQCRAKVEEVDPEGRGTDATANAICYKATAICFGALGSTIQGVSQFIISLTL